jgi:uncharacterized protein YaiI (UPF0178 family)
VVQNNDTPSEQPPVSEENHEPIIWIDNDGCPRMVRELVFNGAKIRGLKVYLVANRYPGALPGPWVVPIVVSRGFDAADNYIAERASSQDLVITSDIPLAGRVVSRGCLVLSTRGDVMDSTNIGERLAIRNLMQELRSAGDIMGGPAALGNQDKKRFADSLDRILTKMSQRKPKGS